MKRKLKQTVDTSKLQEAICNVESEAIMYFKKSSLKQVLFMFGMVTIFVMSFVGIISVIVWAFQ